MSFEWTRVNDLLCLEIKNEYWNEWEIPCFVNTKLSSVKLYIPLEDAVTLETQPCEYLTHIELEDGSNYQHSEMFVYGNQLQLFYSSRYSPTPLDLDSYCRMVHYRTPAIRLFPRNSDQILAQLRALV